VSGRVKLDCTITTTELSGGRLRLVVTVYGHQGGRYGSVGVAETTVPGEPSPLDLEELVSLLLQSVSDLTYHR
jgi:hypothetical protein